MEMERHLQKLFLGVIRKRDYEMAVMRRNFKPAIVRLFIRKPSDPNKGATSDILADEFIREANIHYFGHPSGSGIRLEDGASFTARVCYQARTSKAPFYPVVKGYYYDGNCYHVSRTAILPDGSIEEWGVNAPCDECGDECGVTGLPAKDTVDGAVAREMDKFDLCVAELRHLVRLIQE